MTDISYKGPQGLNVDPRSLLHPGLFVLFQASLQSDGTIVRPSGATILLSQTNFPGLCCLLIYLIWIRYTSVSATPSVLRRKSVSNVADKKIVYYVGILSTKTSTKHCCNTLKGMILAELLQLCLAGLTGDGEIDGQ